MEVIRNAWSGLWWLSTLTRDGISLVIAIGLVLLCGLFILALIVEIWRRVRRAITLLQIRHEIRKWAAAERARDAAAKQSVGK